MERDLKSLCGFHSHVTRAINHLAQSIQQDAEPDYIRKQTLILEEKWKKYESKYEIIIDEYEEEESFSKVEAGHIKLEEEYQSAQMAASSALHQLTLKPVPPPSPKE